VFKTQRERKRKMEEKGSGKNSINPKKLKFLTE